MVPYENYLNFKILIPILKPTLQFRAIPKQILTQRMTVRKALLLFKFKQCIV